MKRIVSIVLALTMLICSSVFVVSAQENKSSTEDDFYKEQLYFDEFVDLCRSSGYPYLSGSSFYNESYYHHVDENDPESQIDWALVYGYVYGPEPRNCYAVIGDRVSLQGECLPFAVGYAVYDVRHEKFIDICDIEDFSIYEGLEDQINSLELGFPIGDSDLDRKLTVFDATYIQRVLAELDDFKEDDDISEYYQLCGELKYVSDFNRDGERNIFDATAIQRKLAELDVSADIPVEA